MNAPMASARPGAALLRFPLQGQRRWLSFDDPEEWVVATDLDQVRPALEQVQRASERGLWAVGMVSYDAGPAFDPAVVSLRHHGVPLVAFGFYSRATPIDGPGLVSGDGEPANPDKAWGRDREPPPDGGQYGQFAISGWAPSRSEVEHALCISAIKEAIAAGDTYQVNQTLRLRSRFTGDPKGLFAALARAQPSDYLAYLDLGRAAVCSASPEMFFERHGDRIITRPMKGTRPRRADEAEDEAMIEELRSSVKDRAENTMIVDMARNDLSRIADVGSVEVTDLHVVETYPTVHQLTSTVTATSSATLLELFDAMFPAASITGAPKYSTTEIIARLEREPRGLYTGTVGAVSPDGTAVFNVAIRTAWIDRLTNSAEYGIGGGIVWDSKAEAEWSEALDKSRILSRAKPDLMLLETMRWEPGTGVTYLDRHLERLQHSARHFGYQLDTVAIKERLAACDERARPHGPLRLRLLVDWEGDIELSMTPLDEPAATIESPAGPLSVVLDGEPVDSDDEFLRHKTSERSRYDQALDHGRRAGVDEVILWNERGEVTETTVGNLVLADGDRLITPPLGAGLLAGTMRAQLLADGRIEEQTVMVEDLARADALYMINSVRGFTRLQLRL